MHCPDCGHLLTPVPLGLNGEANQSYRCYRCGGFWLDGWLANRVKSRMLDKWPQTGVGRAWAGNGTDECPLHVGTKLERYRGDSVPLDMVVKKCHQCGWWWFPGNTIFEFKPAQEAKINYHRLWNLPASSGGLMLPIAALVVLLAGAVIATRLVSQQQFIYTNAASVVSEFSSTYLGNGQAMISFMSQTKLTEVEFKRLGDSEWKLVPVSSETYFYELDLNGLEENAVYQVRIFTKIYSFTTMKSLE